MKDGEFLKSIELSKKVSSFLKKLTFLKKKIEFCEINLSFLNKTMSFIKKLFLKRKFEFTETPEFSKKILNWPNKN